MAPTTNTKLPELPLPDQLAAKVGAAPKTESKSRYADPGDTLPDFATLYPIPAQTGDPDLDDEIEVGPNPKACYLLHYGLLDVADRINDIAEHVADADDLAEELDWFGFPPLTNAHLTTIGADAATAWLAAFHLGCRRLAALVATGQYPQPINTGEEMALHLAVDCAEGDRDDRMSDPDTRDADYDALPDTWCEFYNANPRDYVDDILEDHDVLLLFNPRMDGIEHSEVGAMLGMANLHPKDWFLPFRANDPAA